MVSKLLMFPLVVLVGITFLAQLGIGTPLAGAGYFSYGGTAGFWDVDGHQTCDFNGTAVGEAGVLIRANSGYTYWDNESANVGNFMGIPGIPLTQPFQHVWRVYNTADGVDVPDYLSGFTMFTGLGVLALVGVIMAVVLVVGFHFLGSGESEVGVVTILKGGSYLSLWGLFSLTSAALIGSIPVFGALFWLVLTLMYTIGVVGSIGGSGDAG